jgi:hypothetical protein
MNQHRCRSEEYRSARNVQQKRNQVLAAYPLSFDPELKYHLRSFNRKLHVNSYDISEPVHK